ncbi:hypothetical protein [Sulfurirhabdus autotrophica]|uniref:Uncharacterized protein n=1 Tax=Sulfurirhabdus autotrophica TaxID=1706046 RepID=A0A4R3XZG7_9PROT|nr:hypothetical protein [Sulfurirhabdus autotrophica]TCV83254.1 hypothetical protein EDC63_1164 [Sulfurirhabdus autotrophica]
MLPVLVFIAIVAFIAALILPWLLNASLVAFIHLVFSVGIMPLIIGAMMHFVPVLTRSASPSRSAKTLPVWALLAGLLAFISFAYPAEATNTYYFAGLLGWIVAGAMGWWIFQRGAISLGRPHPCLNWYLAAIGCLMLALTAILLMNFFPEQRLPLRRFHLHLNTLGFIGLTAISTLQVLLPTATGKTDGHVAQRLRSDLKWMVAGVLLIATGAGWVPLLVWPGLLMLIYPVMRLLQVWLSLYRHEIISRSGAAPALGIALLGFVMAVLFGGLHGAGMISANNAAIAYIISFLFPLVTGAASQLLPVWIRPGQQNKWHTQLRQQLTYMAGLRASLFLAAGVVVSSGWHWGVYIALAGLGMFALQLVKGLLAARK